MRYISVFSGIEAATVAFEPLGWEPVAFCEFDQFASAVLAHHYPEVPNLGDIREVDWSPYRGAIDLVIGGSPCQSFSIAAADRQTGLDGESRLMWEYLRCIDETRPRWLLWENVPGVLSSRDNAFGLLLDTLGEFGYQDVSYRVFNSVHFGVPQRRRRVYVVGRLGGGGFDSAAVLFEQGCVSRIPEACEEAESGLTGTAEDGPAGLRDGTSLLTNQESVVCIADDNGRAAIDEDVCGTLKKGGGQPFIVARSSAPCVRRSSATDVGMFLSRRITPRECERLQGFPDDYTRVPYRGKPEEQCPDGLRYRAIGNSFTVPVIRWIGERIAMMDEIGGAE